MSSFLTVGIGLVPGILRGQIQFKRRILHAPNSMQISSNNSFCSFALSSAHEKFDLSLPS